MAAWMKDPYWNLDLSTTSSSTSPAPVATSAVSNSPEIPLSTIVYRTLNPDENSVQSKASSNFSPMILRLRQQIEELLSKTPKLDISFITAPAYKFIRVASAILTAYIAIEITVALYKSYTMASSTTSGGPTGPVIPIDPTQPLPAPVPTIPDQPAPPNKRNNQNSKKRDVRIKLFSEILTGYLTIILSVSVLLGDSIVLKFLMTGLTGFVALVALVLPDQAEWGPQLYNFQEGGFEMQELPVITATSAEGDEEYIFERELEGKEGLTKRTGTKVREMRDKVVERLQEAGSATKKEALSVSQKVAEGIQEARSATEKEALNVSQKVKEIINSVKGDNFEDINSGETSEEEQFILGSRGIGSPDEDLKSQLSSVMAPIQDVLDTNSSIARASRKVEEWLLKGGDSFGSDVDEQAEFVNRESREQTESYPHSGGSLAPPTPDAPSPQATRPCSGNFGRGTLRLR
ncbi:hypothetical protein TWF102_000641 [Orbilia oligospora]|uniref:Uncharacterized protein n=1 Tax=Orbilia oligospora TaxID=2813651 RepID=A0A7C8J253_ORBOL|nr:hypothetical protein TWF102_000641 [Orbilia oligospora]KAF3099246.1 hypothetical protein TWF103_008761 [Orbilia oligospora]